MQEVSLYLTLEEEDLLFSLFERNKVEFISHQSIPKLKIVPDLVSLLKQELLKINLKFSDLHSIYWDEKESSWNSNRLISIFLKTLGFSIPKLSIYIRNYNKDDLVSFSTIKDEKELFLSHLGKFKLNSWREIKALYNSCQITNT
ncbi:hypothetical protein [Mycoplasma suis]|uniref:Uncharacterized protein n=2 Tax=Mycoplasma suis TaxID=57372 RepID=F0QQQ8_MYCSL|nr:hypothetical protein [Mycoplasma suis]ADX97828.1 hypothetical protein MSU_0286 [Mycoplasma suis str. Illinois]CBZ40327.1 similar to retrotransposon peptidase family protein [Mycoplasma suis KI3806]